MYKRIATGKGYFKYVDSKNHKTSKANWQRSKSLIRYQKQIHRIIIDEKKPYKKAQKIYKDRVSKGSVVFDYGDIVKTDYKTFEAPDHLKRFIKKRLEEISYKGIAKFDLKIQQKNKESVERKGYEKDLTKPKIKKGSVFTILRYLDDQRSFKKYYSGKVKLTIVNKRR